MLQRLVRSMVSTEPRPCVTVDVAVMVEVLVALAVGAHVAAGEGLFKVLEEGRIDRHHVFKMAVLGAVLDHQDFAVALDDLGLDLAHFFVEQNFVGSLPSRICCGSRARTWDRASPWCAASRGAAFPSAKTSEGACRTTWG